MSEEKKKDNRGGRRDIEYPNEKPDIIVEEKEAGLLYSVSECAKVLGVTKQTMYNYIDRCYIIPAYIDGDAQYKFSQEQHDLFVFNKEEFKEYKGCMEQEKVLFFHRFNLGGTKLIRGKTIVSDIVPECYFNDDGTLKLSEQMKKVSTCVAQSTSLLLSAQGHNCRLDDIEEVTKFTVDYFSYCTQNGIMPEFRSLANWLGYSESALKSRIEKRSQVGEYLEKVKDAIKTVHEQAALTNAVNNISAMFVLKTQYGYVEETRIAVEPKNPLGQIQTSEEIAKKLEQDIIIEDYTEEIPEKDTE